MSDDKKPQERLPLPPLIPSWETPEPDDAAVEFRRMYGRWDRPVRWREDEV